MARVIYIKDTKEKNLLLLGVSEEGENARYTVNRRLYSDLGMPCVGAELDAGAMEEIIAYDELYRAKKKALSILAYADNNRRELRLKLMRAGFSRDASDLCVDEMVALGYINEERTLERLILLEAGKLRGPSRITAQLVSKGYSASLIRGVMSRFCESGELDFAEIKKRLIESRLGDDADEESVKKLLYKQGF